MAVNPFRVISPPDNRSVMFARGILVGLLQGGHGVKVSYLKEIAAEAGVRPKTLAAAKRGLSLITRLRPDDGELYWFLPPNVVGFFPKEHQSPQSHGGTVVGGAA
jgi:hypothetical protein